MEIFMIYHFKLSQVEEIKGLIRIKMTEMNYEEDYYLRYSLLIEEALIKWNKESEADAGLEIRINDKGNRTSISLSEKGQRIYPFETEKEPGDYIGRMHDRLLSGTGCEIYYRYRRHTNCLNLVLPKTDHEKKLFYGNAKALAVPIAVQFLLMNLLTTTDSILMGFVDQSSLSAISITGSFVNLYNIIITALVTGTTIFASQFWGKRDWRGLGRVLSVSLKISSVFSVLIFCITCFAPRWLMGIYTNIPKLIDLGSMYLKLLSPTFLFTGFYQIYYAIMKNSGKVVRCTVYMICAAIIDCFLNIIMVFGFLGIKPMGIKGAAIGTCIASAVQFAAALIDLILTRNLKISIKSDPLAKEMIRNYVKKSWPVLLQLITWSIADNVITSLFGRMGSDIIAANGIILIIRRVLPFASSGVFETCGIMVGNKLGNGDLSMAKEYSHRYIKIAAWVAAATAALILILNPVIEFIPLSLSPEAFRILHILMIAVAFEVAFYGINCTMNYGAFYAGGDTLALMVIDTINMWVFMIPVGLLCMYVFRIPFIYIAVFFNVNELTSFPFKVKRYRKYKWLKKLTD